MESCKLIVLDHPVTTLHVALSAGIPVIGFWQESAWGMCRQAVPFFKSMREAGFIFETGEEAAAKINEIRDNVEDWWNQESIQKVVREWCHEYARTGNWITSWIKEIWRVR